MCVRYSSYCWRTSCMWKAEKTEFHAGMALFLGFIIAPGKIQMGPAKVSTVAQWPTPDSRKKVQRFLGFANIYRRFIRNLSAIAASLHTLSSPHFELYLELCIWVLFQVRSWHMFNGSEHNRAFTTVTHLKPGLLSSKFAFMPIQENL